VGVGGILEVREGGGLAGQHPPPHHTATSQSSQRSVGGCQTPQPHLRIRGWPPGTRRGCPPSAWPPPRGTWPSSRSSSSSGCPPTASCPATAPPTGPPPVVMVPHMVTVNLDLHKNGTKNIRPRKLSKIVPGFPQCIPAPAPGGRICHRGVGLAETHETERRPPPPLALLPDAAKNSSLLRGQPPGCLAQRREGGGQGHVTGVRAWGGGSVCGGPPPPCTTAPGPGSSRWSPSSPRAPDRSPRRGGGKSTSGGTEGPSALLATRCKLLHSRVPQGGRVGWSGHSRAVGVFIPIHEEPPARRTKSEGPPGIGAALRPAIPGPPAPGFISP